MRENIIKKPRFHIVPSERMKHSMKRIMAVLLAILLMMTALSATADEKLAEESGSLYTKLRVGITNPFAGNFFSETLGNNASDIDVRRLIHDYSLVKWQSETGIYAFDTRVISAAAVEQEGNTYVFALNDELKYSDGSPITVRDYAFSLLLQMSPELREAAGTARNGSHIEGSAAYADGSSKVLSGVRLLSDYSLSITLAAEYMPYFYELQALDVYPLPMAVLAPGCEVKDDGNGVYISGDFSASMLKTTLLDERTGYISHPSVTSGPYVLTEYDDEDRVLLERNEFYTGREDGSAVSIPSIEIFYVDADEAIGMLNTGELDLVVRCARMDQIMSGIDLARNGDFRMANYSRNGLGFISFCADAGYTSDVNVRKALCYCMDQNVLIDQYLGAYGTKVKGFYGLGQWMFLMANGTLVPGDEEEEAAWADLNLDGLTEYPLNLEEAARLLDEAGWNLNGDGNPFDPVSDTLRYARIAGRLRPLRLKMIYPENNRSLSAIHQAFEQNLNAVGIELDVEQLPMSDLLMKYYSLEERDCDMILLGTNFADVFDPSTDYPDGSDTSRLTGITDSTLAQLCRDLRATEPGDTAGYCRKWIAMQEYRTSIASEMPLYSNVYFDFHVKELQNYHPATTSSWSAVITEAFLGDYAPEEAEEPEEETEEGEGDDEVEFFD